MMILIALALQSQGLSWSRTGK